MASKRPAALLTVVLTAALWLGQAMPVAAVSYVSPQAYSQTTESTGKKVGAPGIPRTMSAKLLYAGTWLITAKGSFFTTVPAKRTISCVLTAPGPADLLVTSLNPESSVDLMSHRVTTITGNGAWVAWKCSLSAGAVGDVTAEWVTLTAVLVGTFTNVNLDFGTRTTTGTGRPTVVSGVLGGPVDVPEIDDPQTLASLDLDRGTWVILAKAVVKDYSAFPIEVACRLKPTHDDAAVYLGPKGKGLELASLAWMGIATFTATGTLELICESSGSAGDSQISNIRITAIKVDDSYVKLLPAGAMSTSTTQVFWHDAQIKASTDYASLDIPAGDWLLFVTAQTYDPFDDTGGIVSCWSDLYSDTSHQLDRSALTVSPVNRPFSEGVVSLSAGIEVELFFDNSSGQLSVSCNTEDAGLYHRGRASSIRVVLLRVGDLNFEG